MQFFPPYSFGKSIDLIDLDTLKKHNIDLKIYDFKCYGLCCRLQGNKYFITGGTGSHLTKIVDIRNKTTEVLFSFEGTDD